MRFRMGMLIRVRYKLKELVRHLLPLRGRKLMCLVLNRLTFVSENVRCWWTKELLRDFRSSDANAYHRFLWTHHLDYALTYSAAKRFGSENLPKSRQMFFADLQQSLGRLRIRNQDISSILEVGCSLGYQLRYVETELFPYAADLVGNDIDAHAIKNGARHLADIESRVRLIHGDMVQLDRLFQSRRFDLVFSTGVLMYLCQSDAAEVIANMLKHTEKLLAVSGPAHPEMDNEKLRESTPRPQDGSFIHNFDYMIKAAGGEIVGRRWEGKTIVEGHSLYWVLARRVDAS